MNPVPMSPRAVDLEDEVAHRLAEARWRKLKAKGWSIRRDWDRHDPVKPVGSGSWLAVHTRGIDHLSRWVHRATGRGVYVSEPYTDAFDLADVQGYARAHGFEVVVLPSLSLHYPPYSRAVVFWRGDFGIDDLLGERQ